MKIKGKGMVANRWQHIIWSDGVLAYWHELTYECVTQTRMS